MTTRKSILVGTAVVAAAALWYLFRPDALVISKTSTSRCPPRSTPCRRPWPLKNP